jgi:hypothetical protein
MSRERRCERTITTLAASIRGLTSSGRAVRQAHLEGARHTVVSSLGPAAMLSAADKSPAYCRLDQVPSLPVGGRYWRSAPIQRRSCHPCGRRCTDHRCASAGKAGPYQLQAAIAAIHDEAPSAAATDWPQIMALYELLMQISDNPVVALNHAVAVAMVRGASDGLDLITKLDADERIAEDHRLHAVRAHLLEIASDHDAARDSYEKAAGRTSSVPQQRYPQRPSREPDEGRVNQAAPRAALILLIASLSAVAVSSTAAATDWATSRTKSR